LGLADAQQEIGIQVSIVGTHYWPLPTMPMLERLLKRGARVQLVHCNPNAIGEIKSFEPLLRGEINNADIVHIHAIWNTEQYRAAKYARAAGKPHVFRACGMLAPWSLQQSRWKKWLYLQLRLRKQLNLANAIHFTSRREQESAAALKLKSMSIVEPNGVSLAEFESLPPQGYFRQKHSAVASRPLTLFLGRIHPKKGLNLLIRAIARLQNSEALLVIAGPDEKDHAAEIRALANSLGVASRVLFVGPLFGTDRLAAFRDADVFVLPSEHENFGNAVIESLACGTPAIVSDQVDVSNELTEPAVATVVQRDINELAAAIDARLSVTTTREQTFESCRNFVRTRFDWRTIAARWLTHYQQIMAGTIPATVNLPHPRS
jgi:glycosyltransferase involved in cell wall biosynthesis